MKLVEDIADVCMGYPFRARPKRVSANGMRVVQMRDINDANERINVRLEAVQILPNWENHRLRTGDVLLAARGEYNKAGQFINDDKETVAAANLFVIRLRPGEPVIATYLVWYLNLSQTQAQLRTGRAGSNIPFIPIDVIRRLPIRVPTIEVQKQIVHLHQLSIEEQRLMAQIREKRQQLVESSMQSLLNKQPAV